jgi:hypothetical protein
MRKYAEFYCHQDVNLLKEGFLKFRELSISAFNLDPYNFVTICGLSNKYVEDNVYNTNPELFVLSGTPREFISQCIVGGRNMMKDNMKQKIIDKEISDFDAVSLYPSAMHRLYTLEGIPKVLSKNMLNTKYLLEHLFEDDQIEPNENRNMSGFFIQILITKVNKELHFPIIVVNDELNQNLNLKRSSNSCCEMCVDHIGFQDLIKYQQIECKIIRGYYFDEKRDVKIRNVIENLFQLRLKYKKEENPLQNIIKLILNSIYGKSIMKPIVTKHKFVDENKIPSYVNDKYKNIITITNINDSDKNIVEEIKNGDQHFTFCTFGRNVLSMSKRIMNEVFDVCESNNIEVFYQETDSIHIYTSDIPILEEKFKETYHRELIGKNLGQFHSDFEKINEKDDDIPISISSIFVGKKTYVDMLKNKTGDIAFHCRCKGVKNDVLPIVVNERYPDLIPCYHHDKLVRPNYEKNDCERRELYSQYSIMKLYEDLYDGIAIDFDLAKSAKPSFKFNKDFTILNKQKFVKKLQF